VNPRLGNVSLAPANETASLSISGKDQNMGDQAGIGLQMLERAETEEERLVEDPPQIDVTTTKSSFRWWNVGSTLNARHNAHWGWYSPTGRECMGFGDRGSTCAAAPIGS
jgi:hypothetical protein